MSMIKIASQSDWGNSNDRDSLEVKVSSRGLLSGDTRKIAAEVGDRFVAEVRKIEDQLDPVNYKYAHVISCGATEVSGPNRNGDGWGEDALERSMSTYLKNAKCYRDHKSGPNDKFYGRPKVAFYDRDRGYGRLLVEYFANSKSAGEKNARVADLEIESMEKGNSHKVSHGCFTDPEFPVLTKDRGYVGIADLRVGDEVWTHKGRWRRVYAVTQRQYTGSVYEFGLNGLTPFKLELTANHPMWAKTFKDKVTGTSLKEHAKIAAVNRNFKNPEEFNKQATEWVCAEHLDPGDRMFHIPVNKFPGYADISCPELASLMGYYIAEGHVGHNKSVNDPSGKVPSTVQYSVHQDDSLVRRVPQIVEKLWPGTNTTIRPSSSSDVGLSVYICRKSLATQFKLLMGCGAKTKVIPPEIFNSSEDVKKAFIGAWIDGDGCVDKKGCRVVSASRTLLLQLRDLLASIGLPSAIYTNSSGVGTNSVVQTPTTSYAVVVSWLDLVGFSAYSDKVSKSRHKPLAYKKRGKPACLRECPDGTYAMRISTVTCRHVENVTVYNCEVEEDESFSAAGLASHNSKIDFDTCSICGNEAAKRSQYCDSEENGGKCRLFGCKTGLAKISEEGEIQFVHNDSKNCFYDISSIGLEKYATARQADRIAYATAYDLLNHKTAGERINYGSAWMAEKLGMADRDDLLFTNELSPHEERLLKIAIDLSKAEPTYDLLSDSYDMDAHSVRFIASPIDSIKRAAAWSLASREEVLGPRLFAKVCGCNESIANKVAACSFGIYKRLQAADQLLELVKSSAFTQSPLRLNPMIDANTSAPFAKASTAEVSRFGKYAALREHGPCLTCDDELAASIALQYAGYKLAVASQILDAGRKDITFLA